MSFTFTIEDDGQELRLLTRNFGEHFDHNCTSLEEATQVIIGLIRQEVRETTDRQRSLYGITEEKGEPEQVEDALRPEQPVGPVPAWGDWSAVTDALRLRMSQGYAFPEGPHGGNLYVGFGVNDESLGWVGGRGGTVTEAEYRANTLPGLRERLRARERIDGTLAAFMERRDGG